MAQAGFIKSFGAGGGGCCWRALAASLLAGCSTPIPGALSPDGYASGRYALTVRKGYDAPAAAGLMPEGWKLDNFNGDSPKEGDAYQTIVHVDADGDGDFDWDSVEPAFELRLEHLRHAGVAWLSAVPVSPDLAMKDLPVLTASYLESLAGGEYEALDLTPGSNKLVEKRFASTLLSSAPCRLAANECEAVTFELANVDQLKVNPSYRSHKLMVVISRTTFAYTPRARRRSRSYPVYLFAGYSNQPGQFEAGRLAAGFQFQRPAEAGFGQLGSAALDQHAAEHGQGRGGLPFGGEQGFEMRDSVLGASQLPASQHQQLAGLGRQGGVGLALQVLHPQGRIPGFHQER